MCDLTSTLLLQNVELRKFQKKNLELLTNITKKPVILNNFYRLRSKVMFLHKSLLYR